MEIRYSDDMNIAYFNDYKFRCDKKTGYYLSTKKTDIAKRERLHCYVWRYYNGEIPKGFHIHHIDGNKQHNTIDNLSCIPQSQHAKHHGQIRAEKEYDKVVENLRKNVIPKAVEWHKSEKGAEWHKQHYEQMKDKFHVLSEYECLVCGKKFSSYQKRSKFCSNACKATARRKSGIDNVERACAVCGEKFKVNKYSKSETCSRECRSKLRWNRKYKENR